MKNNTKVALIISSTALFLIAYALFFIVRGNLVVTSEYSTVNYKIDGKKIESLYKIRLFPGKHYITATPKDRRTKTYEVSIKAFQTTQLKVENHEPNYDPASEIIPSQKKTVALIGQTPVSYGFGTIYYDRYTQKFKVFLLNNHSSEEVKKWVSESGLDFKDFEIITPTTLSNEILP